MMYKLALFTFFAALMLFGTGTKAQDTIPKQKYHQNKPLEDQLGYTHAVKTGNMLYISGTTGTGTMAEQVQYIMEDIQGTLQRYNATLKNVVKETVYTTNIDSFMAVQRIHRTYYQGDYPASTWVEVKRLYLPQFLVEIEVVAVLPPEQ